MPASPPNFSPMKKLNFGCGSRTAPGWINIDFYAATPDVQRVNLLKRFPFPDDYFDAVYSSHVLEHFSPRDGGHLISEACRVLKPGGILRTVVPDLEATCREYLRLLDSWDGATVPKQYRWIILELLDQMTRVAQSGEMAGYFGELSRGGDADLIAYVESRAGKIMQPSTPAGIIEKLRGVNLKKIFNKLFYLYLHTAKYVFPKHIRSEVMVLTGFGERHRWMYDRLGLSMLLQNHGFANIAMHQAGSSAIPGFNGDCLDINSDGTPYKCVSLYCEAMKPMPSRIPA